MMPRRNEGAGDARARTEAEDAVFSRVRYSLLRMEGQIFGLLMQEEEEGWRL